MARLLLVEDDAPLRAVVSHELERRGHTVVQAESGERALVLLGGTSSDLLVIDEHLPGMTGIETFRHARGHWPHIVALLITGFPTFDNVLSAHAAGFAHYLEKPFLPTTLADIVDRLLTMPRHMDARANQDEACPRFFGMVGTSPAMRELFVQISRAARVDGTVLIQGETGTGKELIARAIHTASARGSGPLIVVNCALGPASLLEAELFGHERGAFTGADRARAGRIEQARGGTLFLDEIGELPLEAQAKLLRVVETREVTRLGARSADKIDFRLVAATNVDLPAAMVRGAFRADLYYRLDQLAIEVPPLRVRGGDIALLLDHFLERQARSAGVTPPDLSNEALDCLLSYGWPGNVRELEHVVSKLILAAAETPVPARELPRSIRSRQHEASQPGLPPREGPLQRTISDLVSQEEISRIGEELRRSNGRIQEAADRLGINRRTLYTKMIRYGLRKPHRRT